MAVTGRSCTTRSSVVVLTALAFAVLGLGAPPARALGYGVPLALPDGWSTQIDTPVLDYPTSNDAGLYDDPVSITTTVPAHGTAVVDSDLGVTYTPASHFAGTDTFSYTVKDANNETSTALVTVYVVDTAPRAMPYGVTATRNTTTAIYPLSATAGAVDAPLTVTAGSAAHGTVVQAPDDPTRLDYTPDTGYTGPDPFTYTVHDVDGDTSTSTIDLQVAGYTPVAVPDGVLTSFQTPVTTYPLGNDSNALDDPVTVSLTGPSAAQGTAVVNSDQSVTFTPAATFAGTAAFSYTLHDGDGQTSSAAITVEVADHTPLAVPDGLSVPMGSTGYAYPATNDDGLQDGTAVVALVAASPPAHGTAEVGDSGLITYTPSAGYVGPDAFGYRVTDGDGDTSTSTVTVAVYDGSGSYLAVTPDGITTAPGQDAALYVSSNDVATNPVTYGHTSPSHGTASIDTNGLMTYSPAAGFAGVDTFTYTATDTVTSAAKSALVTISVSDRHPKAVPDGLVTTPGSPTGAYVAANDSGLEDSPVTVTAGNGAHGTTSVDANGFVAYTPTGSYAGPDSFTYTDHDVDGDTSVGTVTVQVNDLAPKATKDVLQVSRDSSDNALLPTSNDGSWDGNATLTVASAPAHGTATVITSGVTQYLSYTPTAKATGADSFTYTVTDEDGDASTSTVSVDISDSVPHALPDGTATPVNEKVTLYPVFNDTGAFDGPGTVAIASPPAHGSATAVPSPYDGSDYWDTFYWSIDYTPAPGFTGLDTLTYLFTDADGEQSSATATFGVYRVTPDSVPVAVNDTVSTSTGSPTTVPVLDNDTGLADAPITTTITSPATHGTATVDAYGEVHYTPAVGYTGSDSFGYTVKDADGQTSSATVTVNVVNPHVPLAVDDSLTVPVANAGDVDVLGNDGGLADEPLTVTITTPAAHGTASVVSGSVLHYVPTGLYVGADTVVYKVTDSTGDFSSATVHVTVQDHTPFAVDDTAAAGIHSTRRLHVLANDTGTEDAPVTVAVGAAPSHGTATANADGTISYTSDVGFLGTDTFSYSITDVDGDHSNAGTVTVDVADHKPVAQDDDVSLGRGKSATVDVLSNDTGTDDAPVTVTVVTPAGHGSTTVNADGTITYTPVATYAGLDSFTYRVTDANGDHADATVHVSIGGVIGNGTVQLGVWPTGHLNVPGNLPSSGTGTTSYGLRYVPTNADATAPGCLCEGWGVADAAGAVTGYADESTDGGAHNLAVDSFTVTDTTAVSVVHVGSTFQVTHDYHPSATPNLYEVTVTVKNVSPSTVSDVRYRRVMDWDIEPTAFNEYVTINGGTSTNLLGTTDNGFATANPLAARTPILFSGNATDSGPADHGALFDFGFGSLSAGASKVFHIYYGAAADQTGAQAALTAVGAEAYSLAKPSSDLATGSPNTFAFAFTGVGGTASPHTITAASDTLLVQQGVAGAVSVLANDSDSQGHPLSVTGKTNGAKGTVSCTAAGACTYTPGAGASGSDSFTYTASDGTITATGTVNVTINRPPAAVADSASTRSDVAKTISVLANDTDPDGDALTVTTSSTPSHGSVTCTSTTCTYTASSPSYTGPDSFTYTISDGRGGSSTATVTMTVTGNSNPAVVSPSVQTLLSTPVTLNVLTGSTDPDGDSVTLQSTTAPAHGSRSCTLATGSCTYTPTTGYFGTDSFTFTVSDGHGGTATGTVSVLVDRSPVAVNDTAAAQSGVAKSIAVLANDSDPDGDALSVTGASTPAHGTVGCSATACSYTSVAGYGGPDSFTYTVSDGKVGTATATVSVAVNRAPVATADALLVQAGSSAAVNVLANDTDPDGDGLTATLLAAPTKGVASCTSAGLCTYTPSAGTSGSDAFTYTASDGKGGTATGTVSVTINRAPVPAADTLLVQAGSSGSVSVLANDTDPDGDALSVLDKTNGAHGTVSCTAVGSCTYTPAAGFGGTDTFTYTVVDTRGGAATGTVSVTVNRAPLAVTDNLSVQSGTPGTIDVVANDSDPDGNPLTVTGKTNGAHGTVTCTAAGACTFTAAGGFGGSDSFTYALSDGKGGTATGTVNVAINRPPVAVADSLTVTSGSSAGLSVLTNDTDPDGDVLGLSAKTNGAHGTVSCTAAGACTYASASGYTGSDTFTYTVSDGHGGTDVGTVTVTVDAAPTNGAPTAVNDSATTPAGAAVVISVLANDTDPDGDALTVSAHSAPANGSVTCAATTCTYTPAAGASGTDTFTYTVSDGHGHTATATVTVDVTPASGGNHPPVAVADALATTVGQPASIDVTANDTDADADTLSVVSSADGGSGTVACADSSCTYTPDAGFVGPDAFTYTVSDGHGGTDVGTVSVTVDPACGVQRTLSNGDPGSVDGAVAVSVDGTGAFGPSSGTGGDAEFNPPGAVDSGGSVNRSGLYVSALGDLLSESCTGGSTGSSVVSETPTHLVTTSHHGALDIGVDQSLSAATDSGSVLTQTYTLKNTGAGPLSLVLARHLDGDLGYDGTLEDGGAASPDGALLSEHDSSADPNAVTPYVAISGWLGTPSARVPDAWTLQPFDYTDTIVADHGIAPGDDGVVSGDTDADRVIDVPYDVTLSQEWDAPSLAAGATLTFTTVTHFGSAPPNRPPTTTDDVLTTPAQTDGTVNVVANDVDPDGDAFSVTGVTAPAHGTVTHTATSVTYTPAVGYAGPDTVTYTVTDARGGTSTGTLSVTVAARPLTLTMGAITSPKTYRKAFAVTGTMRLTGTSTGIASEPLELQYRRAGTTTWSAFAKTSGAGGALTASISSDWGIELRWNHPAHGIYAAATSPSVTVTIQAAVSAATNKAAMALGDTATLSGSVAPVYSGQHVSLQRYGGGVWTTIASKTLTPAASPSTAVRYSFPVKPTTSGTWNYRVVKPADTVHGQVQGTSPTVVVKTYRASITALQKTGDEYVTVKNTGTVPLNLLGWKLKEAASLRSYTLPSLALAVGASVRIHTGTGTNSSTNIYLRTTALWKDTHDTARLYDNRGILMATKGY